MDLPRRKKLRLPFYDYRQNGAYFVTICTEHRQNLFRTCFVGRHPCVPPSEPATGIAWDWMRQLHRKYPQCHVDIGAVMPDHVHILLQIRQDAAGHAGPALQEIVQWYKTMTTNAYIRAVRQGLLPHFRDRVWQSGYYEHVVRNDEDYREILQYIENNPIRWKLDRSYEE